MDGTEEVARGLAVTGGGGPVPLEPGKRILDQVSRLVEAVVMGAWLLVRAARGTHASFARSAQRPRPSHGLARA